MNVERVDFVNVATRDAERSRAWYREMLGLDVDARNPDELTADVARRPDDRDADAGFLRRERGTSATTRLWRSHADARAHGRVRLLTGSHVGVSVPRWVAAMVA